MPKQSDTGKREELIQKIADALHADDVKRGRVFVPRAEVDAETAAWYLDNACAAVNVFEQAHTPSDDEREAAMDGAWGFRAEMRPVQEKWNAQHWFDAGRRAALRAAAATQTGEQA